VEISETFISMDSLAPLMRIVPKHSKPHLPSGARFSEIEDELYNALLQQGYNVTKQLAITYEGKNYREIYNHFDLCLFDEKLLIEVDGREHKATKRLINDVKRDKRAFDEGWEVLHIENKDVQRDIDGVLRHIANIIQQLKRKKSS